MIVELEGTNLDQVYQAIKKDSHGSEDQAILCFAACTEADSVCASQLLLNLFLREGLPFTCIPVNCYEEVREHCAPLVDAEEVKTVMLLNCGATEDVRALCNLPNNVRIVILDSHRPVWHGHNNKVDMDTLVLLAKDDPIPVGEVPMYDPNVDGAESEPDESDDESEYSDDEDLGDEDDGEGSEGGPRRGRKRRRETDGDGYGEGLPHKRGPAAREDARARAAAAADRRKDRAERAAAVDKYYSECNGYGKPSSVVLYGLIRSLHHDDNFHVWCAIVALTEQFMFQHISKQQYLQWHKDLDQQVKQDLSEEELLQDGSAGIILPRHKVHIEPCDDLRLSLLRYWTIEESLKYTGYVAARLQTWRQKGMENIRNLLSIMCIPIKAATAPFKGLRAMFNDMFVANLPKFAPQHMLAWDSLHFASFKLQYKHEEVGAADMVFALLGLLAEAQPGEPNWHRNAFVNAQSALHVQRHLHLVERGVEQAKLMCQDVVHECGLMITAGKVKGGRNALYRWVNVAESNAHTNPRFRNPSVLKSMALFLRDATSCRYSSSDARRPMVVAGPPDEQGLCCLVSVHAKPISGNYLQNNPFARPFIETAAALNIVPHKSSFDNATYYVRKEEVPAFLAKLQDVVADYKAAERQAAAIAAAAEADARPRALAAAADADARGRAVVV